MSDNIKVSIIISVYNTEDYLRKCLDSLVSQSLQKIEIIAINNGSTDGSLDILKEYEVKYSSIFKVISLDKNTGDPAVPWNKGIEAARGEYVSIVDSDDWCELNAFERYYNAAKKGNYNLVISNHYEVLAEDEIVPINSIDKEREISTKELLLSPHLAPWGKIIKKSVYVDNNLKYVSQIHCDTGLNMIMYSMVSGIYVIPDNLYYYNHMNPNSETNTKKRMRQATIVDTLDHIIENYNKEWEQEVFLSLITFLHWFCFYEYKFHMDIFLPFIKKYEDEIKRNKYIRRDVNSLRRVLSLLNQEIVPKKIVYGLFGNKELSKIEEECIDSWNKYTTDYDFIELTENNFDIHKYKFIEKAYNNANFELVNKLAVLAYIQENGGIGLSKKMKMNAPIGELRMNDVSYVQNDKKEVYMSFLSCTKENELIKLLLEKLEVELKEYTYNEFEKLTNDFVKFISDNGRQPFNHSKYTTCIFPLNRVGYNFDKNNLFEMMDEELWKIQNSNKKIGKILTEEQSLYLENYFDGQAETINRLTSRIQQLENSRTWRYSQKVFRILSFLKK